MNRESAVFEFYLHPEKHPSHQEDGAVFLHTLSEGPILMVTYGGSTGRTSREALRQAREWAERQGIPISGERQK